MTPTFRIHGYIGDGDNTSEAVGAFLGKHRGEVVDVIINSPGGDALEGGAIMAELQAHGRARCIVRGLAASSASFLLCGADTIIMHRAALLMLHSPWTMTVGDAEAHHQTAALLEKVGETDAAIYASASGNPVAVVEGWLKEELWLSAEEAVALGFADAVDTAGEGEDPPAYDYAAHSGAPEALKLLARTKGWVAQPPKRTMESSNA